MNRYILLLIICLIGSQYLTAQKLEIYFNEKVNSNEQHVKLLQDSKDNIYLTGNIMLFPDPKEQKIHSDGISLWKFKDFNNKDLTFGEKGEVYHPINDSITNFLVQCTVNKEDKIVAAATFKKLRTVGKYYSDYIGINLFRFNQDGSLDSSFGTKGIRTLDLDKKYNSQIHIKGLEVLEDGKILMLASTGGSIDRKLSRIILCKFLPDGSFDESFGDKGISSDELEVGLGSMPINFVIDSKNRIIVSNYFIGGVEGIKSSGRHVVIRRYMSNGQFDHSFGDQGKQHFYTMEKHFALIQIYLDSKEHLVLTGVYHKEQGVIDLFLASIDLTKKFNPVLEENNFVSFDVKGEHNDILSGVQLLENDEILLYGETGKYRYSTFNGQLFFVKLKKDFSIDPSFGENGALIYQFDNDQGGVFRSHTKTNQGVLFSGVVRGKEFSGSVDGFMIDLKM